MTLAPMTRLALDAAKPAKFPNWPATSMEVFGGNNAYRDEVLPLSRYHAERWVRDCYGDAYRAPTDDERAAFTLEVAARKAQEKAENAGKPKDPSLINPTDEDAQRLQDLWNAANKATHERNKRYGECPVVAVWRMPQAEYSARSKGSYGCCGTSDVNEFLCIQENYFCTRKGRVVVFKVRTGSSSGDGCRRVVVLTDKPQKLLPWAAVEMAKFMQPTAAGLFYRIGDLMTAMGKDSWNQSEADAKLLNDAQYVGWVSISSATQRSWTEAGFEACKQYQAILAEGGTPVETGTLFSGLSLAGV